MRLLITRDQAMSGLFSKSAKFMISARLEFDQDEAEAINKYKIGGEVLYLDPGNKKMVITLASLGAADGMSFEGKDLSDILEIEEIIKNACETAKNYLVVASTFGGQEILEI